MLKKKIAYKADDGIYFNVKKFKDYGKLSGVNLDKLKSSVRIDNDEYDKDHVSDFALWKFYDNEDGNVFWETKLGKGRPGWHSSKYVWFSKEVHDELLGVSLR